MSEQHLLNGNDKYIIRRTSLSQKENEILAVLYMPLIGKGAFSLYSLLNGSTGEPERVSGLCRLLDENIYELCGDVDILCQIGLIKLYYSEIRDRFTFVMRKPLSSTQFLSDAFFGRLYLEKTGKENYEKAMKMFSEETLEDDDSEVTSSETFLSLKSWKEVDEENFQEVRNRLTTVEASTFDIRSFLNETSNLVFPAELRTGENLETIGKMATVYGIDQGTMRKLVAKSLSKDKDSIDWSLLRKKCLASKSVVSVTVEDAYQMPPVQFLSRLQNGIPVSGADKRLLEYLQLEVKLPPEVINVLVEYNLRNNNNELRKDYIEKMATTWARQGIDTEEKAKEHLARGTERFQKTNKNLPDYEIKEVKSLSKEELADLRARLFKGQ